ncbi:hypothetical protein D3C81_914100 [compost metagenome]
MAEPFKLQNWEKGANNLHSADRLPAGFVRSAVNVDPLPGGRLSLRSGFERIYDGTAVRGMLALGRKLLIADGTDLVEFDTTTNSARVLRTIAGAGGFCGDVMNDRLYFCTANEALEYDGTAVRPWSVPDVLYQPAVMAQPGGTLLAGYYQIAVTYVDVWGREGGTDKPVIVWADAGSQLLISLPTLPPGCVANVYVSPNEAATLYFQQQVDYPHTVAIGGLRDDTARCDTILKRAVQPGQIVRAHNAVLLCAADRLLQMTEPFAPHLVDRARGFFQFPAPIGEVSSNGKPAVAHVSADKHYALTTPETDGTGQDVVLEYPAIPGTGVKLPDGRGAWMTQYGQVVMNGAEVQSLNRETYAPVKADAGAAGVLDANGNQLIVTTVRGNNTPNPLAAADFYIGEILNP